LINFDKNNVMSTAELKLKLIRKIDTLEKSKLEEVDGILFNLINQDNDLTDWNALSKTKQKGLIEAINEMNISEGSSHNSIIEKYKSKYA
jgi:hypothetical protein